MINGRKIQDKSKDTRTTRKKKVYVWICSRIRQEMVCMLGIGEDM